MSGALSRIGDIGSGVGNFLGGIPGFQGGVSNFRGGLAVVGERGPELVNLPRGSSVTPNGGGRGGDLNVYIAGSLLDSEDFRRAVNEARLEWERAGN